MSRDGIENIARVYEGWTVVSRGMCLTCSQKHQGRSCVRTGVISRCG